MRGVEASKVGGLTQCRTYEEKGNGSQRSYAPTGVHRNHGYQGSKPTVGGFHPDIFHLCSKCGRKHAGTICPGSGNGFFHYKEKGHIKRYSLFSVVDSGATHSLVFVKCVNRLKLQTESFPFDLVVYTPTSGLTVVSMFMFLCPIVGKAKDRADKAVAVGNLCEISDQASGMEPVSAKGVRTSIKERDQCYPVNVTGSGTSYNRKSRMWAFLLLAPSLGRLKCNSRLSKPEMICKKKEGLALKPLVSLFKVAPENINPDVGAGIGLIQLRKVNKIVEDAWFEALGA
ncbi:hypothetical protein Lal_00039305 [Lupinus albus]|nr:hypothetical protein Lal_00039305 [Lupinus albus]